MPRRRRLTMDPRTWDDQPSEEKIVKRARRMPRKMEAGRPAKSPRRRKVK